MFGADPIAKIRVGEGALGDKVHRPAEQRFEPFLQGEIGVRVLRRRYGVELDQEVEITRCRIVVRANGGTECVQPPGAGAAAQDCDFVAMPVNDVSHDGTSQWIMP